MSSDRITMNYDELEKKVSKIRKLKKSFDDEIVDEINDVSEGLGSIWKGEASKAYQKRIKDNKKVFEVTSELLKEFADSLNDALKEFRELDKKVAKDLKI